MADVIPKLVTDGLCPRKVQVFRRSKRYPERKTALGYLQMCMCTTLKHTQIYIHVYRYVDAVPETLHGSNSTYSRGNSLSPFENRLPVLEHRN